MDLPRKRVALAEDVDAAPKGEATLPKTKRWRLRLLQTEPLVIDSETGLGYSSWFIHQIPPCGGYWDTRVDKTSEHQRLWFAPSDDPVTGGGMWYEERAGGLKFVGSHGELGGALWWRGLYRPHPDGYTWVVPGAKRKRVGLV
jgi:hypothetical protein